MQVENVLNGCRDLHKRAVGLCDRLYNPAVFLSKYGLKNFNQYIDMVSE